MSEPGPLLDRAAIQEAFRRLGDRLARNFLHRALPDRAFDNLVTRSTSILAGPGDLLRAHTKRR